MIQLMLAIWSLVPLPFLNPACTSGSSRFTYCWSIAWRILSTILLEFEMSAAAAAAAKSLQSYLTLCDPIDTSPPGSPVPGILQARTLEWVAISFSNARKWKVKLKSLSRVRLLETSWNEAYQAPPPWDFLGKRVLEWGAIAWIFLGVAFFGIGMNTDLFLSWGHRWVFQICWHNECNTLTASSLRIWNSSTGIPSPSLALFVVILPKAHLTSHSRISGSRWVTTPLWLPGSLKALL